MSRDDYNEVSQRIIEFRAKHPEGCLRPADLAKPFEIVTIGEGQNAMTFIVVVAAAYRHPEDPCPGVGMAMEVIPGRTNFTRYSELQNAETSAWGRALIAVGAADAKKGIASADEVRNRARDAQPANPARARRSQGNGSDRAHERDSGPRMITPAMVTRLQIMLTEAGIKERAERVAFCENLAQRPLSSSKDLTYDEARIIMSSLEEAAKDTHQGPPDAV